MQNNNLLTEVVTPVIASDAEAAAQTKIECASIDLDAHNATDGSFLVHLGTGSSGGIVAVGIELSDDDAAWAAPSDPADPRASAEDASDKLLVVDVARSTKRYVRCIIERTVADSEVNSVLAVVSAERKYNSVSADISDDVKIESPE